jgi:pSer/pThr/pTyr-binding forkhead associated (FHA) protein
LVRGQLQFLDERNHGQVLPLADAPVEIGRHANCQIRMNLPGLERRHARVWLESGAWWVAPIAARASVRVGGVVVATRRALRSGDVIAVGPLTITYYQD